MIMNDRLSASVASLIAVNLIPLIGVLFFDWSAYAILVVFWAENLIVGFYTVTRLFTLFRRNGDNGALLMILFFSFHFGGFTFGHGMFVIFFFPKFIPGFELLDISFLGLLITFVGLVISHGISYVENFLGNEEYRDMTWQDLMIAPYRRVVVLHVVTVVGGIFAGLLGDPVILLALLVLLKIGVDVAAHISEHQQKESGNGRDGKAGPVNWSLSTLGR